MDELIAFLSARLAEDELIARAVDDNSAPFDGQWVNDSGGALRTRNGWVLAYRPDGRSFAPGLLDHIARNDPARVLADVAAKRKIVDVAAESVALKDLSYYEDHSGERELAAFVLRQLAQPYADHPAFDPAWRM